MMIPFPVFDYAGPTVLARTAAWTAFTVVSVLAVFLVAMSVRSVRRGVRLLRFSWLHLTVIVAVCYLLAWFLAGPELDRIRRLPIESMEINPAVRPVLDTSYLAGSAGLIGSAPKTTLSSTG